MQVMKIIFHFSCVYAIFFVPLHENMIIASK